ncbi:hypothetical protein [Kocuria carniphila]|uniref:hypothetical protein n=1 Tax=Kocuria carniphila TaxID=262208 RepID=UPI0034CF81AF
MSASDTVTLTDVQTLKASAQRDDSEGLTFGPVDLSEFAPQITFDFFGRDKDTPERQCARITVTAEAAVGSFEVQVAGLFTMPDAESLPEAEGNQLLEQALDALFPFVRAEITDVTTRVFNSGLLAPPLDFSGQLAKARRRPPKRAS